MKKNMNHNSSLQKGKLLEFVQQALTQEWRYNDYMISQYDIMSR